MTFPGDLHNAVGTEVTDFTARLVGLMNQRYKTFLDQKGGQLTQPNDKFFGLSKNYIYYFLFFIMGCVFMKVVHDILNRVTWSSNCVIEREKDNRGC